MANLLNGVVKNEKGKYEAEPKTWRLRASVIPIVASLIAIIAVLGKWTFGLSKIAVMPMQVEKLQNENVVIMSEIKTLQETDKQFVYKNDEQDKQLIGMKVDLKEAVDGVNWIKGYLEERK